MILELTPRITPNGSVELNILVTQEYSREMIRARPMINTNPVNTQVIENGGTAVIGGLHSFYSSLEDQKELILFITPRIIHADV